MAIQTSHTLYSCSLYSLLTTQGVCPSRHSNYAYVILFPHSYYFLILRKEAELSSETPFQEPNPEGSNCLYTISSAPVQAVPPAWCCVLTTPHLDRAECPMRRTDKTRSRGNTPYVSGSKLHQVSSNTECSRVLPQFSWENAVILH